MAVACVHVELNVGRTEQQELDLPLLPFLVIADALLDLLVPPRLGILRFLAKTHYPRGHVSACSGSGRVVVVGVKGGAMDKGAWASTVWVGCVFSGQGPR